MIDHIHPGIIITASRISMRALLVDCYFYQTSAVVRMIGEEELHVHNWSIRYQLVREIDEALGRVWA